MASKSYLHKQYQPSTSTCLQASWPGWDSQRDRPSGNPASYRTLSGPRHHSWSTRLPSPWSLLALSSSSWGPSSSLPLVSVSQLMAGSEQGKEKLQGNKDGHRIICRVKVCLCKCSNVSFYLWPDTQETAAVRCPTFTDSFPISKTFQVVVEIQLHTLSTCCIRSMLPPDVYCKLMKKILHNVKHQNNSWASFRPLGISCRANSPTLVSPFTVHFWVSQFGWQQWFMKRAWFPLGPASMIRSWKSTRPFSL